MAGGTERDRYLRTIEKTLVHKYTLDSVFITDFEETSDTSMDLYALLPRSHSLYCDAEPLAEEPDLVLLIEVCRQACFVVAHELFRMPAEGNPNQFLLKSYEARKTGAAFSRALPWSLKIECSVTNIKFRGKEPSGCTWEFRLFDADRELVAEANFTQTWIERQQWHAIRRRMREARGFPGDFCGGVSFRTEVSAIDVGRRNQRNVVVANCRRTGDGGSWAGESAIDTSHPSLFDHSIDHVYAMVQTECCRQLSHFASRQMQRSEETPKFVSAIAAKFKTVAEIDLPLDIVLFPSRGGADRETFEISVRQSGVEGQRKPKAESDP